MIVGIAITSYNRKELLEICLKTIARVKTDELFVHMIVHNDGGSDFDVMEFFDLFNKKNKSVDEALFVNADTNLKIEGSLLYCFDYLFNKGCELVCNLDADSVVKPSFLQDLIYTFKITGCITTGFNTLSKDANGNVRHSLIANYNNYGLKKTIGGINIIFNKQMYNDIVRPALEGGEDWDWRMCAIVNAKNQDFGVVLPSVVQHTGEQSTFKQGHDFDEAEDFYK